MHGELKQAIAKIQRAAKENEKSSGIYATSGDQAREFADQGFNMVSPWRPLLTVQVEEYEREKQQVQSIIGMLMLHLDISDDGYGCIADIYDFRVDSCQRLLCSFSPEYGKGSSVRPCENDRITRSIRLACEGIRDVFALYCDIIYESRDDCPSVSSISFSTCIWSK